MWYDKVTKNYIRIKEDHKMYAVVAVYPKGDRVLVGFANSQTDVDGLVCDCINTNGRKNLENAGIRICVELAC